MRLPWYLLITGIIADLDVAHVFNVRSVTYALGVDLFIDNFIFSKQEKEIIEYPHSCYVLGRSGTGFVNNRCHLPFR